MTQLLTVVQQLRASEEAANQQQHHHHHWQSQGFNPAGPSRFHQPGGGGGSHDGSLAAMIAQGQSSASPAMQVPAPPARPRTHTRMHARTHALCQELLHAPCIRVGYAYWSDN